MKKKIEKVRLAPYKKGEVIDVTFYNSKKATINRLIVPCKIYSLEQSARFFSGWGLEVMSERGMITIDSGYFKSFVK